MERRANAVWSEGFAKAAKAYEEGRFDGRHIDALLEDPDYVLPCEGWEEVLVRRMGPERWVLIGCAGGEPVIAWENRGHSQGFVVEWAGRRLEGVREFRDFAVVRGEPRFTARTHVSGIPGGESGDRLFVRAMKVVARLERDAATDVSWVGDEPVAGARGGNRIVFRGGAWTDFVEPDAKSPCLTDVTNEQQMELKPVDENGRPVTVGRFSAGERTDIRWPITVGGRTWYVLSRYAEYGGGADARQVESLVRGNEIAPREFGKRPFKPDFSRIRRLAAAGSDPVYIGIYGRPWDRPPGQLMTCKERFHLVHGLVMSKSYDEDLCYEVLGDTIVGYGSRRNRIYRVSRRVL